MGRKLLEELSIDRLIELMGLVLRGHGKKRWLKPSFIYEDVRKGMPRPRKDYLRDKQLYLRRRRTGANVLQE